MAALSKTNTLLFVPWSIALFGWILVLSGVASLQADCKTSGANAIARAGAAGYFAPTPCSKFYGFTWWITVYLLILVFILPILMSINGIRRFRAGLVGLVAIETMLLMDMINSFLYFNTIPTVSGALLSRGRVTVAGGIISAIGLFMTLIGLGIKDEVDPQLYSQRMGARTGETKGGVFTHPGQEESNVVSYNNPLAPVSE